MKVEKLGLVANVRKREIREVLARVLSAVPPGIEILAYEEAADHIHERRAKRVSSLSDCDAILALGGDGTLLFAARLAEKEEIPVLGIKIRSLGFLTEDDPKRAVADLLAGHCNVQERLRLRVEVKSRDETICTMSALNDAVIHGAGVSRVIHLRATIDGASLGEFLGDGVIVSTPTGSTAYSLAAGGPIINPTTLEAFVVTPLCPHSLSTRPIVTSATERFSIEIIEAGQEAMLTVDGQISRSLKPVDRIVFSRGTHPTKLVVTREYKFYDLVRKKLRWGGMLRQEGHKGSDEGC